MKPNILGIDYGSKRVGVAIGDNIDKAAKPLQTINVTKHLMSDLRELLLKHDAGLIVVGLPRNLDGEDTRQTAVVRQFVAELQTELAINVLTQDEALTSEVAAKRLHGKTGPRKQGKVDREAAAIILQDYLDGINA